MSIRIAIAALLIAILSPRPAEARFEPPKLEGHLVDTSRTLRDTYRVNRDLERFRETTGFAIVVFIAGSLQGESITDAAYATFNAWKIGDAGKDNGILVMIAPIERKIRIETGKGLGGAVTDLQANDVITKMGPAMAKYDIDGAIGIAVRELGVMLRKEAAQLPPQPAPKKSNVWIWLVLGGIASPFVVVAILALVFKSFRPKAMAWLGGLWAVLRVVLAILGAVKSRNKSTAYDGGGGKSGGGGSSGSY